jgi:fatty acid synthase
MLLQANSKLKVNKSAPNDTLPRLVVWSGRTEEAVNHVFDYLEQRPMDVEFIGLLQNTQKGDRYWQNLYSGYGIFEHHEEKNAVCLKRDVQKKAEVQKLPIVWVFSGVGSQWPTMGRSFLEIPIIRSAIEKCHKILASKGIDLMEIITSDNPTIFDNILNTFVGVTAIQIGIVDALWELGIEPDYIIGYSLGEIGCAYADGCFTAEQTILAAYYRGISLIQNDIIDGAMAAVGMSAGALKLIVPEDIDIVCYNTLNLCTVAGPAESVKAFVEELKSRKIFAREVNSSHIPNHSRYIQKAGTRYHSELCNIIQDGKMRSPKWISTSVPKSKWNKMYFNEQYSSAEYHLNNFVNPVRFQEASELLPSKSLTIEIAPHEILQSLLKVNLPQGVHVGLAKRNNKDNVLHFLNALGR